MVLFRSREDRLPVYEKASASSRERYSNDDDYYTTDEELDGEPAGRSAASSRNTSGSVASGAPLLSKGRLANSARAAYPYRLPTKVTRYLCIGIFAIIFLMIMSLVRASQVENWKIANGKSGARPPPPPAWERFPFLERYYGGVRSLVPFKNSKPEYPKSNEPIQSDSSRDTPDDESLAQREVAKSHAWEEHSTAAQEKDIQECFIDAAGKVRVPPIRYLEGRPKGFPRNVFGSYDVLGLAEDVCFERFGRFGPYGFGYSLKSGGLGTGENGENEGSAAVWQDTPRVDYRDVDWADVQRRCYQANSDRYKVLPSQTPQNTGFFIHDGTSTSQSKRDVNQTDDPLRDDDVTVVKSGKPNSSKPASSGQNKSRTAVVIRCFDEYFWREDDIAAMRSMITELSLASGGRYDVHLLVQVKNDARNPIWADHEAYERSIREAIPEEFRGLVTLWTETQMLALYQGIHDYFARGPDLPVHGVYRGLSMAMQYFAYQHPEYDYFWQWEMDVRYIGHYLDFFTKVEDWAKKQPRKGLWERNGRFYFPTVHGSWEDFSQMARIQNEMGTLGADNVWDKAPGLKEGSENPRKKRKIVWGPQRPEDDNDWFEPGNDPVPPAGGPESDQYKWGVGEEADYISLNPMFDPEGTTWGLKDDVTGYNREVGGPPRRAHIITTSRMSRRLLMTMHKMTAYKKQFGFPEMWPATVALQHGYKAVFAPHPVYVDRKWPVDYMAQTFNGGRDGSTGGARTSVFGDREHNLRGLSWFYNTGFAPNLYRRWLGLRVNNDGGEEFEKTADQSKEGGDVNSMRGGEGRMCLPPMLLHPVKEVELPVEAPAEEGDGVPESDPGA